MSRLLIGRQVSDINEQLAMPQDRLELSFAMRLRIRVRLDFGSPGNLYRPLPEELAKVHDYTALFRTGFMLGREQL